MIYSNIKTFLGILSGDRALGGPRNAQLNISNICDSHCVMCPSFSPLTRDAQIENSKPPFIDLKTSLNLIREFKKLGTKRVHLVGSGEPLLHPDVKQIIKSIDSAGMECVLVTSGLPLKEEMAAELSRYRILFWIGLHGASEDIWCKIHPGNSVQDFFNLKKCISIIAKSDKSRMVLHNVISNFNYADIMSIVKLAIELGIKNLSFHPAKLSKPLSSLRLNPKQYKYLLAQFKEAEVLAARHFIKTSISEFNFISPIFPDSSDDQSESAARNSFSTKLLYTTIPCYIGWLFTRIDTDGSVIPCCSSKLSLGNIHAKTFESIWFSEEYNNFRRAARNILKEKVTIKDTKCDHCINYVFNVKMNSILRLKFIKDRLGSIGTQFKSSPSKTLRFLLRNPLGIWQ